MSHDDGEKKGLQYSTPDEAPRRPPLDLTPLQRARAEVPHGSVWMHVNTGLYYVVRAVGFVEADLSLCVIYSALNNVDGVVWTRPLAEFCDGRFEQQQIISPSWGSP